MGGEDSDVAKEPSTRRNVVGGAHREGIKPDLRISTVPHVVLPFTNPFIPSFTTLHIMSIQSNLASLNCNRGMRCVVA